MKELSRGELALNLRQDGVVEGISGGARLMREEEEPANCTGRKFVALGFSVDKGLEHGKLVAAVGRSDDAFEDGNGGDIIVIVVVGRRRCSGVR